MTTPIYLGAAKRIEDIDLPRIGARIGVGEDILHAFIEVETRGTGFDKQGRVLILFEPHVFWKLLGAGEKRKSAVAAGLAYKNWGQQPYPRDSYPRLTSAMIIDETAALMACSWGMSQIMGSNFKQLGYSSVQEMVQAFADDEDNHLEAMIEFIKANKIDDDLRRLEAITKAGKRVMPADCVSIVRVYNGAGYAKNEYHTRFAAAYNRWLKIKDTPYAGAVNMKQAAALEETRFQETPELVIAEANPDEGKPGEPVPPSPAKPGEAIVGGRPDDAAKQVTQGGGVSRMLTGLGGVGGVLAAIGGFMQGKTGIIIVSILAVVILILALMFRQVLLDYLRLTLGASPDKYNVK